MCVFLISESDGKIVSILYNKNNFMWKYKNKILHWATVIINSAFFYHNCQNLNGIWFTIKFERVV